MTTTYGPRAERDTMRHAGALDFAADDVARLRTMIVNVCFVGRPGDWVLVDTGMPLCGHMIERAAFEHFGGPPRAVVLTHGHFDHVGSVKKLAQKWDVEAWAHPLEMPYLTGRSDYPPPDPTVGGGLMAGPASSSPAAVSTSATASAPCPTMVRSRSCRGGVTFTRRDTRPATSPSGGMRTGCSSPATRSSRRSRSRCCR